MRIFQKIIRILKGIAEEAKDWPEVEIGDIDLTSIESMNHSAQAVAKTLARSQAFNKNSLQVRLTWKALNKKKREELRDGMFFLLPKLAYWAAGGWGGFPSAKIFKFYQLISNALFRGEDPKRVWQFMESVFGFYVYEGGKF